MALAITPVASAQETAVIEGLEEITVTARRREETLHDVPIAISAFSGEYLEEIGMANIIGVTQSTPNVTLEVSRATSSTLTAFIRGIGQQDPVAGFEGGVGIYLDDVYLARPQGTVFEIYDIERVEVLRGPQGTLYGRNTIGGAVRYVTRALDKEPALKIRAGVGTYSQFDAVATFSLPVTDTFRFGGSLASFNRDGFGTNLVTGGEHYDKDVMAGRLSFEWDISDSVMMRVAGDYTEDKSAPKSGHRLTVSNLTQAPILPDVFDTRAGIETIPSSTGGLSQKVTQGGVSMDIQWDINDTWIFKSITADRSDDSDSLIDFDSLPDADFDAPVIYTNEQFSQEFQLLFTGEKLSGVMGFYYLDANAFDAFDVILGNLGVTSFTLGDYDTEAWAVFADVDIPLSETVKLSLGARYTEDKRSTTVTRDLYLGLGSPYFGNDTAVSLSTPIPGKVPTFNGTRTDSDTTPRVSVSWEPTDTQNLYASISQGFKGGSFDPRGAYGVPGVDQGFEPENVTSYEIGAKSIWADGRATTAAAVFYSDYTDIQVPGSIAIDTDGDGVNDSFAGATTNAGKAEIFGVEFEGRMQFTDSFSGMASFGYIDADYTEWLVAGIDISGERYFQNTPKWTANAQLRKEWDTKLFGMDGSIFVNGGISYKDDMYQFEIPNPLLDTKSYTLVDLSVGWYGDDGKYSLMLHGRNLTDEEYKVASYDFPTLGLEGVQSAFYGDPLTVALVGTVNF